MATLIEQVDAKLAAFAIEQANDRNLLVGPWTPIDHGGERHYLVKGNGNVASTLETNDKLVSDVAGQIVVHTCLDAGHVDIDTLGSAAWDQNAIG